MGLPGTLELVCNGTNLDTAVELAWTHMGNPLQLILVFFFRKHSVDLCHFLFQKSSPSLGDGPHDIGLPGCLFYRIPHKVCVPLKKATASQSVKSLATQSYCVSVSKVFGH